MPVNEPSSNLTTLYKYFQAAVPFVLFISLSAIVIIDLKDASRMYLYWELVSVIVIIVLLPFVPYISRIRFRDTEVEISDAEWMEDRAKLRGGTTATPEGDKIHHKEIEI